MKAYLAIKFYSNHNNKNLIKTLKKVLADSGHKSICVASDIEEFGKNEFNPKELMATTFNLIDKCDFLVVEATEKGVGLGIEAGYSYAKGKPIIILAEKGTEISTTLKGIANQIFFYENPIELVKPLGEI